jgi:Protein of unknown function (DUF4238)
MDAEFHLMREPTSAECGASFVWSQNMSLIVKPYVEPPKVRNSHIIPRFYLNKFADSTKQTFIYEKGRQPRKKSTKTQCLEIDYFEYEIGKEVSNNKHEMIFAGIENLAGKAYAKILRSEPLNQEHLVAWALFVATVFLRSRKVRNQVAPRIMNELKDSYLAPEQIRDMQYELFKHGQLVSEVELSAILQKTWDQINANPAYLQLAGVEKSACNLGVELGKKHWHTLEAAPEKVFVTSDCPVFTWKLIGGGAAFPGYGFGQEDVAIILPLSPKKVFVASPPTISWPKVLDANSTDLFNKAVIQFADKSVFH